LRSPDAHRGVEPRLGDHEKADARAVRIGFAMARHDRFVDHLHQVWLFAACSRKDLQKVAEDRRVAAGNTIANEGDNGDEFFVIIDGTVRVSRQSRKFAILGPGIGLGELALLLENAPRNAACTAGCE